MPRGRRQPLRALLALAVGAAALVVAVSVFVEYRHRARLTTIGEAPAVEWGLVFGAGLAPGAEPSPVLAQRLDAAHALYRAGKVRRLLLSGDASDRYHDETAAMRRYLLARGIPAAAMAVDEGGVSTFASVVRAQQLFGLDRAILVTQGFHLPRALFIARELGMDAFGVSADRDAGVLWPHELRELFSRPLAWGMVLLERHRAPGS